MDPPELSPPTTNLASSDHRPTRGWQARVEKFIILSGIYVFSIGPMYWTWYDAKFVSGPTIVAAFYEPLWWLARLIPLLGSWLDAYVRWWIF